MAFLKNTNFKYVPEWGTSLLCNIQDNKIIQFIINFEFAESFQKGDVNVHINYRRHILLGFSIYPIQIPFIIDFLRNYGTGYLISIGLEVIKVIN